MKNVVKRGLSLLVMLAVCIGIIGIKPATTAEAATKMTRAQFIIATVKAMKGSKNSAGKEIGYTLNKDGSAKYCGKTITSTTVSGLKSKYGVTLESAQYLAIAADMGLFTTTETYYKSKDAISKNVNYKIAVTVLVNADEYLNGVTVSSADLKLAKSRIANLKKAGNTTYQTYFAKAYALGFYVGTKGKDYSTTRTIKSTSKPSKATCEKLIARLTNKSKRYKLTDDLQVIRTTKLPKTADLYPYILDSFPNAYYDTAWIHYGAQNAEMDPSDRNSINFVRYQNMAFKDKLNDKRAYFMPAEFIKYCNAGDNECVVKSEYRQLERKYKVFDQAVEFYTYAMNVDYRTIKDDKEWYAVMNKYLSKDYLDNYIKDCIKNQVIVECDVITGDTSTFYSTDTERFKMYLHFRVVSDKVIKEGLSWKDSELVPVLTSSRNRSRGGLVYYMNYKLGDWVDYYVSPGLGFGDKLNSCDLSPDLMLNYFDLYPWLIDVEG